MMNSHSGKDSMIIALGGGKGGVGKSMICANLAIECAKAGFRVVLVDLDIGGANVHTIFGMRRPPKGLAEYFMTQRSHLDEYILPTEVPNLKIIAGGGIVPELANLRHLQKIKLVHQIRTLDADLIFLDLGAGTSHHVIDFFSMTQAGIVVTTPEPTAVINAYEFLKNVFYRILFRMFRNQRELLQLIRSSALPQESQEGLTIGRLIEQVKKEHPWAARNIEEVCSDLHFYLILNQARKPNEIQLGLKLCSLCDHFLNLPLCFGGMVFHNEEVSASVVKMSPIALADPESITSNTLRRIATDIFYHLNGKMRGEPEEENRILRIQRQAQEDFRLNLLAQKRAQRENERRQSHLLR